MSAEAAATAPKPSPRVTLDSEEFWRHAAQGHLMLRQCRPCGHLFYYPRVVCPRCLSTELSWRAAGGRGTVHAVSVVHRAPDAAFRGAVPYAIALIDLAEGVRVMSNVTDCAADAVAIGMAVEVWFDPVSADLAIPKFRPVKG